MLSSLVAGIFDEVCRGCMVFKAHSMEPHFSTTSAASASRQEGNYCSLMTKQSTLRSFSITIIIKSTLPHTLSVTPCA